jgi:hypothetical protein
MSLTYRCFWLSAVEEAAVAVGEVAAEEAVCRRVHRAPLRQRRRARHLLTPVEEAAVVEVAAEEAAGFEIEPSQQSGVLPRVEMKGAAPTPQQRK